MKTKPMKEEETQNKPNQWKKKKYPRTVWTSERRREKKNWIVNPGEERKKKSQKVVKMCDWVLFVGPLCMFNYNIVIEL